jgi:hypothetical protein
MFRRVLGGFGKFLLCFYLAMNVVIPAFTVDASNTQRVTFLVVATIAFLLWARSAHRARKVRRARLFASEPDESDFVPA